MLQVDIRHTLPDFTLQAAFSLPPAGIHGIIGHSGAGKSTLLRILSGLTPAQQGQIRCGDTCWQEGRYSLPPEQRSAGMVFQDSRLFHWLTVRENLQLAARFATGVVPDYPQLAERLGFSALLDMPARALSGGQKQRVALARALMATPRWLLLDEPLSALDHRARRLLLDEIAMLSREFCLPMLYVSHAMEEVVTLCRQVVLLNQGRVEAIGSPVSLFADPALSLAQHPDAAVLLETQICGYDSEGQQILADCGGQTLRIPGDVRTKGRLLLRIMAREVILSRTPLHGSSLQNALQCQVTCIGQPQQGMLMVQLSCAGQPLLARISYRALNQLDLHLQDHVL
ncbi:MAG: molybdenum ABC transporter ATP-binding protein, partial [Plesiomonas sp.]